MRETIRVLWGDLPFGMEGVLKKQHADPCSSMPNARRDNTRERPRTPPHRDVSIGSDPILQHAAE